jgi:hypothetical protein
MIFGLDRPGVVVAAETESPEPYLLDFAALFSPCSCGRDACEDCEAWQLTPRTAAALWVAALLTADTAYDDVAANGDTSVMETEDWELFDQYPPITYRCDAEWRRRAARAYDDLAADLSGGRWPEPRCPAEEMALHLILERAEAWAVDADAGIGVRPQELASLPAHADDLNWSGALDALFADHDILLLFGPEQDGIEDPASSETKAPGSGTTGHAPGLTPSASLAHATRSAGFGARQRSSSRPLPVRPLGGTRGRPSTADQ